MDPKLVYIGVLLNINLGLCSTDKTLGYGTKFGTVLEEDSKKVIGLGAPPGFLNGDNEQVILDVYQRYLEYKLLQGAESNDDLCQEKCPPGSHCSSGVCFCDTDIAVENLEVGSSSESNSSAGDGRQGEIQLIEGVCVAKKENRTFSPKVVDVDVDEVFACNQTSDCWSYDVNFLCQESQCVCRNGTKYDKYNSECSIFLEVDCSIYHPDSPVAESLKDIIEDILVGNVTTDNRIIPESLLAFLEPITTGLFTKEEIDEAFCRDVHSFGIHFADRDNGATIALLAVILGVVVVVVLLVLGCVTLSGCVCWCCFDSCRRKMENLFSSNSYTKDLDGKSGDSSEKDGGDQLEKAMSGYQPVPQHPPPGYPQGSTSLPRGCSLPSKNASLPRTGNSSNRNSLARGVSPIPRAYPQLAEAPPGYPESPQKTGPPPLGYPQSPPEYPQTPTPPGFPTSNTNTATGTATKTSKPLYPQIPEK